MDLFDAIILGLIQGITEFLPISSSGHLVLAQFFLGIKSPGILLEIILHLGTLFSIIVFYRMDLLLLYKNILKGNNDSIKLLYMVGIGIIPIMIVGLLYKDELEVLFEPRIIPSMLFFSGCFLMATKFKSFINRGPMTYKIAILIGLLQVFAIFPGISRSGITISSAILLGVFRNEAAKFSFFMAIPLMFGAAILQIINIHEVEFEILPLIIGFIFSFVSGLMFMKLLMKTISNQGFWKFSIYCFALSLFCISMGLGI